MKCLEKILVGVLFLAVPPVPAEQLIFRARGLHPEFPGLMDSPVWEIDRNWCRPKNPECDKCYMNDLCRLPNEPNGQPDGAGGGDKTRMTDNGSGVRLARTLLNGKLITIVWLADQLRPLGLRPKSVWIKGTIAKGYLREDFLPNPDFG